MPYSKKNKKSQLSRKKVATINPREYTIMGTHPTYVHFNPAGEKQVMQPISHSLEKWILMILLAFAMAAFMGFKLLENSDLSFSLSDTSKDFAAHSVSSEEEFKNEFNKNRQEARAMMNDHKNSIKKTPKYGKGTTKYYANKKTKSSKKFANKKSSKKRIAKNLRKKTLARRN